MNYKIFENRLKYLKKTYGTDLWSMTVSANKITGKSFLILKNSEGKVVECILLTDESDKYTEEEIEELEVDGPDDELRKELGIL